MPATTVTDDTFEREVLQADLPVLVDFWAEWCAPCRKMEPVLDEIADEMDGRVRVVKLNTDESPQTALAYRVMGLPTLTVFKNGEPVQSVQGARPKSFLLRLIEESLI